MDGTKFSAIAEDPSIQASLHLGTSIRAINSIPLRDRYLTDDRELEFAVEDGMIGTSGCVSPSPQTSVLK
jgi:hypothetical protein